MKVSENSSSHVTVDVNLPSVEGKGAGSATEEEEEGRCREILSMQNANPAKSIQQKRQQTTQLREQQSLLTKLDAIRDIAFCGTGFTNGLNTNPWSAAAALTLSLEGSVVMMAGFVDTLGLKKVGTPCGNVPVVGDGSDCFKQKSPFMNNPEKVSWFPPPSQAGGLVSLHL
jgi:hypothetical protein